MTKQDEQEHGIGPSGVESAREVGASDPSVYPGATTPRADDRVPLAALQREAGWVNELNGVVAHLVGALDQIVRCPTLEAAQTCAEMAMQNVAEYHAGHWKPGPGDDPADWRRR